MKIKNKATILTATLLMTGCVSSINQTDIQKYKDKQPQVMLSDLWYIDKLNNNVFGFDTALFVENQVKAPMKDAESLCSISNGKAEWTSLDSASINEAVQKFSLSSKQNTELSMPVPGTPGYFLHRNKFAHNDADHVYISGNRKFNSDKFIDSALIDYDKKHYFGKLNCQLPKNMQWSIIILPGDVYYDSSKVLTLPLLITTN
ncbi:MULTISPECIES: hypothetical protein [Dickeya]|uniref:hypothetical protein n=1 Tax=Dickeya TaxID=204037 RepID=UPI000A9AA358|nr:MULTISPECIES: hypothetical protein [Dickeya]UGA50138.1 hypothetical protein QR68_16500 [Dickeya fangzhongdai]UWH06493.1 hypothetical protein K0H75_16505 [Dickeya fangzhongdai]